MGNPINKALSLAVKAVHFAGSNAWLVAAIAVPIALATGRRESLVLVAAFVALLALARRGAADLSRRWACGCAPLVRYRYGRPGLIYLALTFALCAVAVDTGDNLSYLSAALLASLLACSMAMSAANIRGIEVSRKLPGHIFAGEPSPVTVSLSQKKRGGGSFAIEVAPVSRDRRSRTPVSNWLAHLAPRRTMRFDTSISVERRGVHKLGAIELATRFPLGLVEASLKAGDEEEVLVLPRLGRINREVLAALSGPEAPWVQHMMPRPARGDFKSLREYRHGDNVRFVHWRTSARMGKLYVKEFEREETDRVLILFESFAGDGEAEARFEKAVSFTATLAELFLKEGIFYSFASCNAELVQSPFDVGPGQFYNVLESLAIAVPAQRPTIGELVAATDIGELGKAKICVISPGPLTARLPAEWFQIEVSSGRFNELFTMDR